MYKCPFANKGFIEVANVFFEFIAFRLQMEGGGEKDRIGFKVLHGRRWAGEMGIPMKGKIFSQCSDRDGQNTCLYGMSVTEDSVN
jgi:hypothetical protein